MPYAAIVPNLVESDNHAGDLDLHRSWLGILLLHILARIDHVPRFHRACLELAVRDAPDDRVGRLLEEAETLLVPSAAPSNDAARDSLTGGAPAWIPEHRVEAVTAVPADPCPTAATESHETRLVWPLPSDSSMVMRARLLTRALLTDLGSPDHQIDDGELMVCELATNAIRHADGPFELRADDQHPSFVSCGIFDTLGQLPPLPTEQARELTLAELKAADPERLETGRGLDMVHRLCGGRLSARFALSEPVSPPVQGKAVWFSQRHATTNPHEQERRHHA